MKEIDFPTRWITADVIDHQAFQTDGGTYIIGVLLADGTNLWTVVFDGGHRFMRTHHPDSPLLLQDVEKHGEPSADVREDVEKTWDMLRAIDIAAGIRADALGRQS